MSVADRLNKLSTDITNAYTSINNKGGTIPANKNTNNLSTAIDSIQSSNIIGATAEGESLSLTNTKAMPYSDYVVEGKSEQDGEPSPSNPSEIHSVADDVNLFDASKIANSSIVVSDNGKTIIMPLFTSAGGYTSTNKKLSELCPELKAGEVAYLHFIKNIIGIYNNYIYLVGSNRAWQKDSYATITEDDLNSTVILYGNDYSHGETEQLIITDFKIQKGSTATPYSPYNQGTVTIKQRGTTESDDYTLQTEPLRSLPNGVKDTIEVDGIHRRVGRVVLDGSEDENWGGNGRNNLYGEYSINIGKKPNVSVIAENNMISNRFTKDLINNSRIIGRTTNNNLYVNLSVDILEYNLSNFKTWLSTHNTEVLYELAEEVIEPLTQNQATTMLDITKTGSYEGTTNIYTDEDVKPTIGVGYYKKS